MNQWSDPRYTSNVFRFLIALTLVLLVAGCGREASQTLAPWPPPQLAAGGDPAATIAALKTEMPAMIQRAAVPGLSMAILANGAVAWSGGFGVADVRTHRAMTGATIVEAASLGEPVLATIALSLVESGRLDLDSPIARWYADPNLKTDARYGRITLRQLLSHTAGLGNLRANQPEAIFFSPGDHFSDSGVGYLVAQRLIETVTGEPLEQTAVRVVFRPAAMADSSFVWQPRFDDHTAIGHDAAGQPMPKRRPSVAFAPASLQTTAEDYGRFLAALVNGRLIGPPMLGEMWREQIAVTPDCVECLSTANGRSTTVFWGLGWGIDRTADGVEVWHWGDTDIFRGYVVLYPAKKSGLAFLSNSVNGLSLRDDLIGHIAGGTHPDWDFVKYDQYDSPMVAAANAIQNAFMRDPVAGAAEYQRQKALGLVSKDETTLDTLGFRFFTQRLPRTAVAIWELEAQEFPQSWHPYDNLGLGYKVLGDADKSLANYRKAIAINPSDPAAKRALSIR